MVEKHLTDIFFARVAKYVDRPIFSFRDDATSTWIPITWKDAEKRIKSIANSLQINGIEELENIGIYSQNMPEIILSELAMFCNRAVSVPIYATSTIEQVNYIVNDASIKVMCVGEQQQYDKAYTVQKESKILKQIIIFDRSVTLAPDDTTSLYLTDYEQKGATSEELNDEVKLRQSKSGSDDLACLIYTSGTTGDPKGVMLYHSNILKAVEIHDQRLTKMGDNETSMCFLPLSHIFEKMWSYYCMHRGVINYINLRPTEVQKTIKEVHPTLMCSVPRFWEKVYDGVQEKINNSKGLMRKLFEDAIDAGYQYNVLHVRQGKPVPAALALRYKFYNRTIFKVLKTVIGIERGNFFPCAGSPLSDTINQFLHSCGIDVCYGYGLTESTATVSCFLSSGYTFGTVGTIMPDVQVKIADDGEILLKGGTIFKGYYNRPETNREAFIDGWFRTGDAGRLTENNELIITDRIKDLFKTSNGKYVAPQAIEIRLQEDPYIEQVALIGDNRKFITALIVPTKEALMKYAAEQKIPFADYHQLLERPEIKTFMTTRIDQALSAFAQFEQVKRFTLLHQPFSMEGGELTNTLKLKRKIVAAKYKTTIDEMYY